MLIEKVGFNLLAVSLFIIIFFKMIARNDTSYVTFLILEFIGIFIEFIEILKGTTFAIWIKCITYFIAIVLPIVIIMLEKHNKYLLEYIYIFS